MSRLESTTIAPGLPLPSVTAESVTALKGKLIISEDVPPEEDTDDDVEEFFEELIRAMEESDRHFEAGRIDVGELITRELKVMKRHNPHLFKWGDTFATLAERNGAGWADFRAGFIGAFALAYGLLRRQAEADQLKRGNWQAPSELHLPRVKPLLDRSTRQQILPPSVALSDAFLQSTLRLITQEDNSELIRFIDEFVATAGWIEPPLSNVATQDRLGYRGALVALCGIYWLLKYHSKLRK